MKQIILHTARWVSVLALTVTPLAAAILTVDNKPGSVAMFNNLQAAYNAAQQDDTIVLAASPTGYGSLNVYKRLHFRGPGYLLSENGIPGTELAGNDANVGFLFYNDPVNGSSSGSTVSGLRLSASLGGSPSWPSISINFDKCVVSLDAGFNMTGVVSISRSIYSNSTNSFNSSLIALNVSNSIISDSGGSNYFGGTRGRLTINNSVVLPPNFTSGIVRTDNTSSTITNTIFSFPRNVTESEFLDGYKGNISHCMVVGGSFLPAGNNNINNANLQDVFLAAGSDDARWQLKPASPARGAGLDGVDLGAFGGVQPYILSGLPSKPRLTRFIAPAVATEASGLRIELEAKSY